MTGLLATSPPRGRVALAMAEDRVACCCKRMKEARLVGDVLLWQGKAMIEGTTGWKTC